MFNTNISLYGIMLILALLSNILVVIFTYNKTKFNKDEIICSLVYENIGIIIGAKFLTYIQNYKQYTSFNFIKLGLSSYGAVIGAIVFLVLFALQFKKSIKDMLFTFMPSIPLMYAIGKIGCFLVGCCYGIKYNGPFNIVYKYSLSAPNNIKLFPVQIMETILFSLIFIYMIKHIKKNKFTWKTLGISYILCGIAKFSLDFFRASHINVIISLNQILSIIFIIIGTIIIIKHEKKLEIKK